MSKPADWMSLQCTLEDDAGLAAMAARWCAGAPLPLALHRVARQAQTGMTMVHARLPVRTDVTEETLGALSTQWMELCPQSRGLQASRLQLVFDAPGASVHETPAFHYVVQTDAEDGWMDEIVRWYDTEHMPGLAGVPGCVHARRLISHDHGPRSLACYDLVSEQTLGSPPWLAVRGTAWSDKTRPHFTNTRRNMFKVLA